MKAFNREDEQEPEEAREKSDAEFAATMTVIADIEAEIDDEETSFEEDLEYAIEDATAIAFIEEYNTKPIAAMRAVNIASGIEVDEARFCDRLNETENYLPPLAALPEAEQKEVADVLEDATPFPGCVEDVQTAKPGNAEAAAASDTVQAAPAMGAGVSFSGFDVGYVPPLGTGIFSFDPETD